MASPAKPKQIGQLVLESPGRTKQAVKPHITLENHGRNRQPLTENQKHFKQPCQGMATQGHPLARKGRRIL